MCGEGNSSRRFIAEPASSPGAIRALSRSTVCRSDPRERRPPSIANCYWEDSRSCCLDGNRDRGARLWRRCRPTRFDRARRPAVNNRCRPECMRRQPADNHPRRRSRCRKSHNDPPQVDCRQPRCSLPERYRLAVALPRRTDQRPAHSLSRRRARIVVYLTGCSRGVRVGDNRAGFAPAALGETVG